MKYSCHIAITNKYTWRKNDHNTWLYKYNSLYSSWNQSFCDVRDINGRRETKTDYYIDL